MITALSILLLLTVRTRNMIVKLVFTLGVFVICYLCGERSMRRPGVKGLVGLHRFTLNFIDKAIFIRKLPGTLSSSQSSDSHGNYVGSCWLTVSRGNQWKRKTFPIAPSLWTTVWPKKLDYGSSEERPTFYWFFFTTPPPHLLTYNGYFTWKILVNTDCTFYHSRPFLQELDVSSTYCMLSFPSISNVILFSLQSKRKYVLLPEYESLFCVLDVDPERTHPRGPTCVPFWDKCCTCSFDFAPLWPFFGHMVALVIVCTGKDRRGAAFSAPSWVSPSRSLALPVFFRQGRKFKWPSVCARRGGSLPTLLVFYPFPPPLPLKIWR